MGQISSFTNSSVLAQATILQETRVWTTAKVFSYVLFRVLSEDHHLSDQTVTQEFIINAEFHALP